MNDETYPRAPHGCNVRNDDGAACRLPYRARTAQGKDLETIDLKRTARSATAGLLIHGPLCHFWIELMQNYLVSLLDVRCSTGHDSCLSKKDVYLLFIRG